MRKLWEEGALNTAIQNPGNQGMPWSQTLYLGEGRKGVKKTNFFSRSHSNTVCNGEKAINPFFSNLHSTVQAKSKSDLNVIPQPS